MKRECRLPSKENGRRGLALAPYVVDCDEPSVACSVRLLCAAGRPCLSRFPRRLPVPWAFSPLRVPPVKTSQVSNRQKMEGIEQILNRQSASARLVHLGSCRKKGVVKSPLIPHLDRVSTPSMYIPVRQRRHDEGVRCPFALLYTEPPGFFFL